MVDGKTTHCFGARVSFTPRKPTFFFEQLFGQMKETLMWLGECWMQQGMLASPDDIRFASWALVQQTVTGDVSPSAFADAVVRGEKGMASCGTQGGHLTFFEGSGR